ncbi:MAG: hypothetical protein ICV74_11765, partial [Thermoleophilia bacterium]|nr:hypothetical protein [Thermoleophilia bacterium]
MRPTIDWFALSPVLVLLGASGIALMAAVLGPRRARTPVAAFACALGFSGAFAAAVLVFIESAEAEAVIAEAMRRDRFAALAQM